MRRLLSVLAVASVALALVVFSQASSITATPIYLSVPSSLSYVVFNAVNVTYLSLPTAPDLANYTITVAAQHINVTIKLVNVNTGTSMEIRAWIPKWEYQYIYLAPNISSVIFFINATEKGTTQVISPYTAGDVGLVYNSAGKQVNSVYAIGFGTLMTVYNGQVMPVNQTPIFDQYLNGQAGVQYSVTNGYEGIYILYVTT